MSANVTMRAAVSREYGGPEMVTIEQVRVPVPGRGHVLVRVIATPVTRGDTLQRSAAFPRGLSVPGRLMTGMGGPRQPILGAMFVGVVTARGAGVTELAVGDRVAGVTGMSGGAHAEHVVAKAASCTRIPRGVTARDAAAAMFGGITASVFLERGGLHEGARVLVNGASGEVGAMAVQLAASRGASVTGVASGTNEALVRRLGATAFLDRTRASLADHHQSYDLVLDTVGNLGPKDAPRLLTERGRLVLLSAGLPDMVTAGRRTVTGSSMGRSDGLDDVLRRVEERSLSVVIDRVLPLDEIVDAHRRVDSRRKVGAVVVEVSSDTTDDH